jgi:ATP diphosphatase
VPENLPALLYARKVQRRARSAGVERGADQRLRAAVEELLDEAQTSRTGPDASFDALGDLLFAVVDVARERRDDPELALRVASDRYRNAVEGDA